MQWSSPGAMVTPISYNYAYFKIEPRLRTPEYGIKFLRVDKVVHSLTPMSRRC